MGFVYLRPLHVVAVKAQGPYSDSAAQAWSEMFDWLSQFGLLRQIGTGYGLMFDDPRTVAPENCRYQACVELIQEARGVVPDTFTVRRLPGGAYARQRHIGGVVGLANAISKLRNERMPDEGIVIDSRRPVIIIYLDNPEMVPLAMQRVDVCMPVAVEMKGRSAA